ncbi:MAG: hypothetical protein LBM12_02185 [Candidatus Nomurabacteria bacterium]|jgi:hypothetical protein|nr:hypothetical protein [Candidatus Nomurabacteria bacterium]
MGKEIIHVEVDEDIAAVISRVMAANEQVVAVVAPKNLGALRSAMNLKLLKKAAKSAGKIVAVVSDSPVMRTLAGVAGVPLAASLQSKPEVPEIESAPEGQLVAEELAVGEGLSWATSASELSQGSRSGAASAQPVATGEPRLSLGLPASETPLAATLQESSRGAENDESDEIGPSATKNRRWTALTAKVDTLWKKVLVGGGLLVGAILIGVLVLFLLVRPSATVEIATVMQTIDVRSEVRFKVKDNNVEGGLFQLTEQSLGVEQAEEFEATGEKLVGEKAKGTVSVSYCGSPQTLTTQQYFEGAGKRFYLDKQVTLDGALCADGSWKSASLEVTAADMGEEFNEPDSNSMAFSGDPFSYQTKVIATSISGGTKQTVKVVSEEDVKNATERLDTLSIEEGRSRLKASLADDLYAFDLTFLAESGNVEVSPKVGETVADGTKATIKRMQTYKIMTASKPDMEQFARSLAEKQADGKKIYQIGSFADGGLFLERAMITAQTGGTICPEAPAETPEGGEPCVPKTGIVSEMTALLKTVATAGDDISESEIAAVVKGQKLSDANRLAMEAKGVQRVSITLKPFWASRLPEDISRITVKIQADQ